MKKILSLIIILFSALSADAIHIKGGWIYYEYLGKGLNDPTKNRYRITVKVYRDCTNDVPSHPQNDQNIPISIYNGTSSSLVMNPSAPRVDFYKLELNTFDPCIQNPPKVCYLILQYQTEVELSPNAEGYTLSFQRCCRIAGIQNVAAPSSSYGNSYTTTIPGTIVHPNGPQNSSPQFAEKDAVLICFNAPFTLDYSATQTLGEIDSLYYYFSPALNGGGTGSPSPNPAPPPPYSPIGYQTPYSPENPFNTNATINSKTGIITGIAPSTVGEYVLSVSVDEFRNGVKIGTTRKEIHINVGNCQLTAADLKPDYFICDVSTVHFQNEANSSDITSYKWDFGVPNITTDTSSSATPVYTYQDTGLYTIKLSVANAAGCKDEATAVVHVFPGFKTDFNVTGSCFLNNYQFTDLTVATYGAVNSWTWNFGDVSTDADSSKIKNPVYKYPVSGPVNVQLITSSTKGCIDTIMKTIDIKDRPTINLPFKDTLICSIDTLQLLANNTGTVQWTPNYNIINPNSSNPFVYPKDTTVYKITVNDNGCINTDSVTVNVLDFIEVEAGPDVGICLTDSFRIPTVSHALSFMWTPAAGLSSTTEKQPMAAPAVTTRYYVTANLGKCQDSDSIRIVVTPYPQSTAGSDTTICFNTSVQLHGSIVGSSFFWTPTTAMQNASTLNPTVNPLFTTNYVLTVFDTIGCPKPARDTIRVNVVPQILANAGRDTSIVANQPLQMNATGGSTYLWSPATGMSAVNIPNPIVTLNSSVDSILYTVVVTEGFCSAFDQVRVKVYKTGPEIFVPSAFTPNSDGRNDNVKPIIVGMRSLEYFSIYSRWGQLLYTTTEYEKGWDGNFNGVPQASGTYVYIAQAIDYTGKTVFRKGTIVLIR
jgi:gliding motility-associated-like protein